MFDLFHIGHLNLLRAAKSFSDKLIVAVSTDDLVVSYKGKAPVIPFAERIEIIRNLTCVDMVVPQYTLDKYEAWQRLHFNVLFTGDDWYGHPRWNQTEVRLSQVSVKTMYLPYTRGTSSTLLAQILDKHRDHL